LRICVFAKTDEPQSRVPSGDRRSINQTKGEDVRHLFHTSRLLALGSVLALVLAACSQSGGGGGDASGASIGFDTPTDGATVTVPFQVKLNASVPLGAPETGNHHAHIYFDSISTNTADYDIVYGTSEMVTRQLSPGQHTLIVALANPDHSLVGPKQEIKVTVGGGSGGASGGASSTPAPTSAY
jgi:hypothetical protein